LFHLNIKKTMVLLVAAMYVLMAVQHTWQSTVDFLCTLGFVAFVLWVDPERKSQVSREEFQELQSMVAQAKDDIKATRLKIGLIKS